MLKKLQHLRLNRRFNLTRGGVDMKILTLFLIVLNMTGCTHKMNLASASKTTEVTNIGTFTHIMLYEYSLSGIKNKIQIKIQHPPNSLKAKYSIKEIELLAYLGQDKIPTEIDFDASKFEIFFINPHHSSQTNTESSLEERSKELSVSFDLRFKKSMKNLKGEKYNLKVFSNR